MGAEYLSYVNSIATFALTFYGYIILIIASVTLISKFVCTFFRCWDDGQMLLCQWKACPKVYHLPCLGMETPPTSKEKWYCPWHFCVQCGETAISHCIHCPNAYCKAHDSVLKKHKELGKICDEHNDDIDDLVNFYRDVGGIQHLVPNPNEPLSVDIRSEFWHKMAISDSNEEDGNITGYFLCHLS